MAIIAVSHLTHQYRRNTVDLKDINLKIEAGSIYGFLGPNGAGKTTTLKLILGLLKKQQGEIQIFGKPFDTHRIEILQKIGSLIETPSIYSHLTAFENLQIWQKIYQCPINRLNVVLKLVGLADTGTKKTRQFSLGMKQRLGIALALLNDPEILILDEPTNGLDPNGIIEVRELLKKLNQEQGITILISSHLLAEIEKLVTHIGIIHHGQVLFEGTLDAFTKRQKEGSKLHLRTNNNEFAFQILKDCQPIFTTNNNVQLNIAAETEVASILKQLIDSQIDVYEAQIIHADLETQFMHLVNQ